jgi:hypothetical protein
MWGRREFSITVSAENCRNKIFNFFKHVFLHNQEIICLEKNIAPLISSSLAKGYDPLYSASPLASLDEFSRSHGDGLYVMQLVVAATNQNALDTSRLRANKDIFSVYNSRYKFALIVCQ